MSWLKLLWNLAAKVIKFLAGSISASGDELSPGPSALPAIPNPLGPTPQAPKPGIDPTTAVVASDAALQANTDAAIAQAQETHDQAVNVIEVKAAQVHAAAGAALAELGNKAYDNEAQQGEITPTTK